MRRKIVIACLSCVVLLTATTQVQIRQGGDPTKLWISPASETAYLGGFRDGFKCMTLVLNAYVRAYGLPAKGTAALDSITKLNAHLEHLDDASLGFMIEYPYDTGEWHLVFMRELFEKASGR